MTKTDLAFLSITELAQLFRSRKLSPVELIKHFLARIDSHNPELNAYLTVTAELALDQAQKAESELSASRGKSRRDRGLLHGIPIALKDNIHTAGIRTTAGSKFLKDFIPDRDAHTVTELKAAGAIILGKTNLHEFAYGVTTNNPHFGPTRNPWDTARVPGGSSGGAAAAVAAGLCVAAIGTDTGGSIRIPASLCGIVGFKPSLHRVSVEESFPCRRRSIAPVHWRAPWKTQPFSSTQFPSHARESSRFPNLSIPAARTIYARHPERIFLRRTFSGSASLFRIHAKDAPEAWLHNQRGFDSAPERNRNRRQQHRLG